MLSSLLQYWLFPDGWTVEVCHAFNLNFFGSFLWAHRVNAVLAADRAAAPDSPADSPCAWSEHRCSHKHCATLRRSLSDQISSSDEELSCKMWTMSKDGFIPRPKLKLQAPHLPVPLWAKSHLEFQLSLNLNYIYSQTTITSLLKKFYDIKFSKCSSKVGKLNKNMLLKYVKVWVNISNVKIHNIRVWNNCYLIWQFYHEGSYFSLGRTVCLVNESQYMEMLQKILYFCS